MDNSKKIISFVLATSLLVGCNIKSQNKNNNCLSSDNISIQLNECNIIKHKVNKGESLSKISNYYYGNSNYWKELALYNEITDPDFIKIDQIILVPKTANNLLMLVYGYKEYNVQSGDNLYEICKYFYNDGSRTTISKLATYNNLINQNLIITNQILRIPSYVVLEKVESNDYSKYFDKELKIIK